MKLKIIIISIALLSSMFLVTDFSLASTAGEVLDGFGKTGSTAGYPVGNNGKPTNEFTKAFPIYFVGLGSILSGLAVILFIYAGWLWMTAQGNDEQIAKAKKIMLGTIIGLLLLIFARLIAELTFNIFSSAYQATQSTS